MQDLSWHIVGTAFNLHVITVLLGSMHNYDLYSSDYADYDQRGGQAFNNY